MYVSIVLPIIFFLSKLNLNKITEINKTKTSSFNKNILIYIFLSLGGLPPFLGFTAKLLAIVSRIKLVPLILLIVIVVSSLVSLFYYSKIFYNMSINTKLGFKINTRTEFIFKNKLILISCVGNLIVSLIVLLI